MTLLQKTVREVMDKPYFAIAGTDRTRRLPQDQAQAFINTLLFPSQEIMVEIGGHKIVEDWFRTLEKAIHEATLRTIYLNDMRFAFELSGGDNHTHASCTMSVSYMPDSDSIRQAEIIAEIYMHDAYTPCVYREDTEAALPRLSFLTMAEFLTCYPVYYAPQFGFLDEMDTKQLNSVLSMQEVMSLFGKADIPQLTGLISSGQLKPGHHVLRDFRDRSKVITTTNPFTSVEETDRDGETVSSKIYMDFSILNIYRKDATHICAVSVKRADHAYEAKRGGPQTPAWVVQDIISMKPKALMECVLPWDIDPHKQMPLASFSSNPNTFKGTVMKIVETKTIDVIRLGRYRFNDNCTLEMKYEEALAFMQDLYFRYSIIGEADEHHAALVGWFEKLINEIAHLRKETLTLTKLIFVVDAYDVLGYPTFHVYKGSEVLADITLPKEVLTSGNNTPLANVLPTLNFLTFDQYLLRRPGRLSPPADAAPLSHFLSIESLIEMLKMSNSPGLKAFLDTEAFTDGGISMPVFLSTCHASLDKDVMVGLAGQFRDYEMTSSIHMGQRVMTIWCQEHVRLVTCIVENQTTTDPRAGGYRVKQMEDSTHAELTIAFLRRFNLELDTDRAPTTMPEVKFKPLFNATPTTKESQEMHLTQTHEVWNQRNSKHNEPMILIGGFGSMFANMFMKQLDSVDDTVLASNRIEAIFSNCINAAVRHGGWKENILAENDYYYEMFANPTGVVVKVKHGIHGAGLFDLFFAATDGDYYRLTLPAQITHDDLAIPVFDPLTDLAGIRIGTLNKMLSMEEFQYMFSNAGSVMGASVDDCLMLLSLKHDLDHPSHEAIPAWEDFTSQTLVRIDGPSQLISPDENIVVHSKWERVTFYDNFDSATEMSHINATGFLRSTSRDQAHSVVKATGAFDNTAKIVFEVQSSIVSAISAEAPDFSMAALKEADIAAAMASLHVVAPEVPAADDKDQRMVFEVSPEIAEKTSVEAGMAFADQFLAKVDGDVEQKSNPLLKSLTGGGSEPHHLQVNPIQMFSAPIPQSRYADQDQPNNAAEVDDGPQHLDSDEEQAERDRIERESALRTTNLSITSKDYSSFMHIVEGAVAPFMSSDRLNLFEAFQNYTEVLVDHTVPHPLMAPVFTASVGPRNHYQDRDNKDSAEIIIRVFVEVRMGEDLKATFLDDIAISRHA